MKLLIFIFLGIFTKSVSIAQNINSEANGYIHFNFIKKTAKIDTLFTASSNVVPVHIFYMNDITIAATKRGGIFISTNPEHIAPSMSVFEPNSFIRGKSYKSNCFINKGRYILFLSTIEGTTNSQLVKIDIIKYKSCVVATGNIRNCFAIKGDEILYHENDREKFLKMN